MYTVEGKMTVKYTFKGLARCDSRIILNSNSLDGDSIFSTSCILVPSVKRNKW